MIDLFSWVIIEPAYFTIDDADNMERVYPRLKRTDSNHNFESKIENDEDKD